MVVFVKVRKIDISLSKTLWIKQKHNTIIHPFDTQSSFRRIFLPHFLSIGAFL
jgi:hypothetical protein